MPDPVVDSVEPNRGWNGEDTVVTIHGSDFYPQVELDAGRRGSADLDEGFAAWLSGPDGAEGRFELSGVSANDTESLRAIVGAGLEAGLYDLVVEGPTGRLGSLPDGFTVSNTRADHIVVDAAKLTWEVNELAQLEVYLLDPHGERVFTELPIALVVTGDDGTEAPVTFGTSSGLEDPLVGAATLTGDLGPDGTATVLLSVSSPGIYAITATPLDDRSAVDDGDLKLLFEPGGDLTLDLRLPDDPFAAVAGEPFALELELRDQFGNSVPDVATTVALRNVCSTWVDLVLVSGITTVEVQLDQATGEGCPEDAIVTDEASTVQGSSAPFEVLAGPVDHFDVDVLLVGSVMAGDDLFAQVVPVDPFGNEATWTGVLTLEDSVGGLGPSACTVAGNVSLCTAQPTVAAEGVVLHVSDELGVEGFSEPYDVLPGSVITSVGVSAPATAEAGTPVAVDVLLYDTWGNVIDAAGVGSAAIEVVDELGEADCVFAAFDPGGAMQVDCTLYTARSAAVLTATAGGVSGSSGPFTIDNGPLGVVDVAVTGPVTAGQSFAITLTGTDAWGNPYVVQSDPTVALSDSTGTLSVATVDLGPGGTVTRNVTITAAGTTEIEASQGGVTLGTSASLTVLAGATSALRVTVLEPWAWRDVPTEVRVEAIDAWGNRTDSGGTATIASRSTATAPLDVTLVNGVATAQYTWTEARFDDVLDGSTTAGFIGESEPLHVVVDCAAGEPTVALAFDGFPEALACFDEVAGYGTIAGSFAGSTSGGAPIASYVLAALDGSKATSPASPVLLDLPSVGIHPLAGLVAQSDYCAVETEATAYVGLDDGEPVGPIAMVPVAASVDAGVGVTDVLVEDVVDCSRDVAAGGTVKLRTVLGALDGTTPTGSGLAITLDANGDGLFTLDVATAVTAGEATLHAWVDPGVTGGSGSGAAAGLASVAVVQDLQLPTIWEQLPAGETLELVDEVRLVFSEPIRAANAVPANFSVAGPSAVSVIAVTLENGDTEAVLGLDPPADGALGSWTVTATDSVRDLAGNRLDGGWAGVRGAYEGVFGAVASSVDAATCGTLLPDGGTFRPDGDDGANAEADTLEIDVSSAVAPTWWVVSVTRQSTGALKRRDYLVPAGATETITWDGRDQAGRIVDNGVYVVDIEPLDGLGNRGEGCTITATVDNRVGGLP